LPVTASVRANLSRLTLTANAEQEGRPVVIGVAIKHATQADVSRSLTRGVDASDQCASDFCSGRFFDFFIISIVSFEGL
jgi:hypothetical protein